MQVFLEFDAPFWAEGEEVIKIAWGKQVSKKEHTKDFIFCDSWCYSSKF